MWYFPVKEGRLYTGSDEASKKWYVRRDCVLKQLQGIVKVRKCDEIYQVSDQDFWNVAGYDTLKRMGKLVYKEGRYYV